MDQYPNPTFGRGRSGDPALDRAMTDVSQWGQRVVALLNKRDGVELLNQSPVPAPVLEVGRLYVMDVAGKMALMVQFPTGAAIQIAIEP